MNPVIIGQGSENVQNNIGQKADRAAKEAPRGDSFSDVFADTASENTPRASVANTQDAKADLVEPEAESNGDDVEVEADVQEGGSAETERHPVPEEMVNAKGGGLLREGVIAPSERGEGEAANEDVTLAVDTPDGDQPSDETGIIPEARETSGPDKRGDGVQNTSTIADVASQPRRADSKLDSQILERHAGGSAVETAKPADGVKAPLPAGQATPGIEASGAQNSPKDVLTLKSTDSVEELPIAYQVRLGVLPQTAQTSFDQVAADVAPTVQNQSATMLKSQQAAAGDKKTDGNASARSDGASVSRRELMPEQVAANKQFDVVNATDAPKTAASAAMLQAQQKQNTVERAAEVDRGTTSEGHSEDAEVQPLTNSRETVHQHATLAQASQAALLGQAGAFQQGESHDVKFGAETRIGLEAVGINQVLAEATFRPTAASGQEMAQRIAVQLSEAFASKGERKVDVMLNPKELGRVKMQLATNDGAVRVIIQTERAETGDLMRRNIGELEREFQEMGFENISFEFSSGGGQTQSGGGNSEGAANSSNLNIASNEDLLEPQTQQPLNLGGSGLDMRV